MPRMATRNRQWRLAAYPEGLPSEGNWALSDGAVPEPGAGELLVRGLYVDVAPYMRGRISRQQNYAAGVSLGEVMTAAAVAEVVRSNAGEYRPGDLVVATTGWQEFAAVPAASVRRVDPQVADLPHWLDALGTNGPTAYFALLETGRIKPGDTVVISAAAGSVGQIAGQIAKLCGCRAIAVTSSAEKLAWCREIGYDDGIDYRAERDLSAAIARVCPNGVDVYFDNTAGPILDAVMQNLATFARVVVVGTISLADRFEQPDVGPRFILDAVMQNLATFARVVVVGTISLADRFEQPDVGPRFMRRILVARARIEGFLSGDYAHRSAEAYERLAAWHRDGVLRSRFDIAEGIESLPGAFLRLLTSRNIGKQLVRVAEPSKDA